MAGSTGGEEATQGSASLTETAEESSSRNPRAAVASDSRADAATESSSLETFLADGEAAPAAPVTAKEEVVEPAVGSQPVGLRSARLISVDRRKAQVRLRRSHQDVSARVAPEVDPALVAAALKNHDSVMVEADEGEWLIVGVLQTRVPELLELKARTISIDAEEELILKSGRAATRLRRDGDIEIVGSRISAASRGLFKLVGRMLRLN